MPRPFFETLRELRAGRTLEDLQDALTEAVQAVADTGKHAEIKLTLRVRPPRKGSAAYVTIEDDVTVKLPKRDRGDTVFFPLPDGSLSRQDPNQMSLGLRSVGDPTVDLATGEILTPSRSQQ